jgi:predicted MFS family arabinose efflux permease
MGAGRDRRPPPGKLGRSRPGKIASRLILTKSIRVFSYSFISIILPVYLVNGGYSPLFIGIVMTVTILAAVPLNLAVLFLAPRLGERMFLVLLALLMAVSGLLFAWNPNWVVILVAAFLGAISVTGAETGPFQSMEQSLLATASTDAGRTSGFGIYNFAGYIAMSLGSLFSGAPDFLAGAGVDLRPMFVLYSALAAAMALVYCPMPAGGPAPGRDRDMAMAPETKRTVGRLSVLFSLDAFGGGFVIQGLLALWFFTRFGLRLESLSFVFFVSGIITSLSIIAAPWIAGRIGLLRTMVFTHLPSNIFLILVPLAPDPGIAVALLLVRQSISQMDVPTRQSYAMAIIRPQDRTSSAAVLNIPRTVAQGMSPSIASYMIGSFQYSLPFFIGGAMKIIYDIALLLTFRKVKPPEEY